MKPRQRLGTGGLPCRLSRSNSWVDVTPRSHVYSASGARPQIVLRMLLSQIAEQNRRKGPARVNETLRMPPQLRTPSVPPREMIQRLAGVARRPHPVWDHRRRLNGERLELLLFLAHIFPGPRAALQI
jgi:hypothetical protein